MGGLDPSGSRFKSCQLDQFVFVAQWLEQGAFNPKVEGSSPSGNTKCFCSSPVERGVEGARVVGSIPAGSTNFMFSSLSNGGGLRDEADYLQSSDWGLSMKYEHKSPTT